MIFEKKIVFAKLLFFASALLTECAAADTVSAVKFSQRWPWNGKVDIEYTLSGSENLPVFQVGFYGKIDDGESFALTALEGEGGSGIALGSGVKRAVWNASADMPATRIDNLKIGVVARNVTEQALYLTLDLTDFKMSYGTAPPDPSLLADKTSKIWFKRIGHRTFQMGSPNDEPGRGGNETLHEVTITRDFYIGVFELTEGQYDRIMNGSAGTSCYPKAASYFEIRGSAAGDTWPSQTDHRVDKDSILGHLNRKAFGAYRFDLPTEAQWELANRTKGDGTLHGPYVWNDGVSFYSAETNIVDSVTNIVRNVDWSHLDAIAWALDRTPGTEHGAAYEVGLKLPSSYGLYDMHGNLWEWCLDLSGNYPSTPVTDPVGNYWGNSRSRRGGSFWQEDQPSFCRITKRFNNNPNEDGSGSVGARLVLLP